MDSDSRNERERLKEEYKAHYRKMREAKECLSRVKKKQNIAQALKNMDKSQMLESFDTFLHSVKHKLASVEARLDVAVDSLTIDEHLAETGPQLDEEMNRTRAKETLKQLKMEMGLLYEEIEQQAGTIQVEKTIGSGKREEVEETGDVEETKPRKGEETKTGEAEEANLQEQPPRTNPDTAKSKPQKNE